MSTPQSITPYPIGIPGTPWGTAERNAWLARQRAERSYAEEVVARRTACLRKTATDGRGLP